MSPFSYPSSLHTPSRTFPMNPQVLIPEIPLSTLTVPQYALLASYCHSLSAIGSPIARFIADMEEDFSSFQAHEQRWATNTRIDYTGVQIIPLIFHYEFVQVNRTILRNDSVLLLNAVQLGNAASDVPFPPQVEYHWTPPSAAWVSRDRNPRWTDSIKTVLEKEVNFTLCMALSDNITADSLQREALTESIPFSTIYDPIVTESRVPNTAQSAGLSSQPQRTSRSCAMFGMWTDMIGIKSRDRRVSRWFTEEDVRSETQMSDFVQRGILAAFEARRGDTRHGQSCGLLFGQMSY